MCIRDREARTLGASRALAEAIGLSFVPRRIEGYDISNTQGVLSVAAMVVFIDGSPAKKEYRHFRIKTVVGANDFASMHEVLTRRFAHARRETEELREKGADISRAVSYTHLAAGPARYARTAAPGGASVR